MRTEIPKQRNVTPAHPRAIYELKTEGKLPQACQHRPVKHLNNIVEQDHLLTYFCRSLNDTNILQQNPNSHTPGVSDLDQSGAFRGDFPDDRVP